MTSAGAPAAPARSRKRLWVAGAAILGALVFLLVQGLSSSLVYFKTADEAVADRAQLGSQTFRIEGVVVPGSVRHSVDTVSFAIQSRDVRVDVTNHGSPPQLFQPNVPVVLDGHFAPGGERFLSDQIMVKHSAAYIAQHPSRVTAPNGSVR